VPPDQALNRLIEGNRRYLFEKMSHPSGIEERRRELAKVQHPFAVVLGCADSRVPPEIVFHQGLGDLFVVRVAGNIVDDAILGSIEFAVENLGASAILVLGHERCGAVQAAIDGGEAPGHVGALITAITPAVESVKGLPGDGLDNAVCANVKVVAAALRNRSPLLEAAVQAGRLVIAGGRYDLDTGIVEILVRVPAAASKAP
jgi:carbonic anhydrase